MKDRPNVIVILTDDQRAGTIHALGNDIISTPNMDALCERGTAFTRAHITGGTVSAVCMPSRAMINTGRTLFHIQGEGQSIPPEHTTVAECLRSAGYHTHGIGKWHNGPEAYARGFESGDDIFFGGMWDHWNVPVCDFKKDGNYDHFVRFTPNFNSNSFSPEIRADRINAGVHSTDLFSRDAVRFIENYNEDRPFYVFLSFLAPHDPRTMPEEFRAIYDPERIPLPDNYSPMPVVNCGWAADGRDENTEEYPRRPERIKKHIADYYSMITHVDARIGEIVTALEKRGFLDDTVIVLMGDNGLAVGQHGLMGKQNIYEHSVSVPLVMAGPGIPAGVRDDRLCCLIDVFPTLCDLCGIGIPQSVEGKSLVPLFSSPDASVRKYLYFAFQGRIRGISDGRYKLIEYRTEDLKLTQLFDLEKDPGERFNFFDMHGYEEITSRLRARLLEYRKSSGDEDSKYGRIYWQAWDNYEKAVVPNPGRPSGKNIEKSLALKTN